MHVPALPGDKSEVPMWIIKWSDAFSAGTQTRNTAVGALAAFEEFTAANRSNVNIFNSAAGQPLTIEQLRVAAAVELAEAAP